MQALNALRLSIWMTLLLIFAWSCSFTYTLQLLSENPFWGVVVLCTIWLACAILAITYLLPKIATARLALLEREEAAASEHVGLCHFLMLWTPLLWVSLLLLLWLVTVMMVQLRVFGQS